MLGKYKIEIHADSGDRDYEDWSQYLQLPFNITEAGDSTYDTASVILKRTSRKAQFKPGRSARVTILDNDDKEMNQYDMIVESDRVEEEYIGPRLTYTHNVSLMERTKLLDNIILPDFSVTNPATIATKQNYNFSADWILNKRFFGPPDGENDNRWYGIKLISLEAGWQSVPKQRYENFTKRYNTLSSYLRHFNFRKDIPFSDSYVDICVYINMLVFNDLNSSETPYISSNLNLGESIDLPIIKNNSYATGQVFSSYTADFTETLVPNMSYSFEIYLRTLPFGYKYQYSSNNGATWNDLLFISDEYYIEDILMDNKIEEIYNTALVKKEGDKFKFTPKEKGKYKIRVNTILPGMDENEKYSLRFIHLIELTNSNINRKISDSFTFLTESEKNLWKTNLFEMMKSFTIDGISGLDVKNNICLPFTDHPEEEFIIAGTVMTGLNALNTNQTRDSFDVSFTVGEDTTSPDSYEYKTIRDILTKIINMIPSSYGKYYISDSSLLNTIVPEKTFIGKSVSEVLFELGTLINAYPYLTAGNYIGFKQVVPKDSPFTDSTENISYTDDLDNRATAYNTGINNLVSFPDGQILNYSYWPGKDAFSYMNGSDSSAAIDPDKGGITIYNSEGIYKLISFKVTNILSSDIKISENVTVNKDVVVDLSRFIHEKTFYSTLYPNESSYSGAYPYLYKKNCLYWTKGSNYINLGDLPESEKINIWGSEVAPETYALQNAIYEELKLKLGLPSTPLYNAIKDSNITNYKFQVVYIETYSGNIKTEKFNIMNDERNIEFNYNQTSNNITDDFNDMAQIDILRRGNSDFVKTVFVKNIAGLPRLGEFRGTFFADNISYNFDNNIVGCNINYTNNYSKINKDVSLSKDYRQFEIYASNIVRRNIPIDFYMYISKYQTIYQDARHKSVSDIRGSKRGENNYNFKFISQLSSDYKMKTPKYAIVFFKDKNGNPLTYTNSELGSTEIKPALIPLSYKTKGNSVILSAKLSDNYAVKYIRGSHRAAYKDAWGSIFSGKISDSDLGYMTEEVRYVDDNGEVAKASFYILNPEYDSELVENGELKPGRVESEYDIFGGTSDVFTNKYILIGKTDMDINKDNREALTFTCQIHILSNDQRIKWHPALCKYMFNGDEEENIIFKRGTEYYDDYKPVYIGSVKKLQNEISIPYSDSDILGQIQVKSKDNISGISFSSNTGRYESAALIYPKTGEILFHIDDEFSPTASRSIPSIHFTLTDTKINNLI